jgi:hypothetical protein
MSQLMPSNHTHGAKINGRRVVDVVEGLLKNTKGKRDGVHFRLIPGIDDSGRAAEVVADGSGFDLNVRGLFAGGS